MEYFELIKESLENIDKAYYQSLNLNAYDFTQVQPCTDLKEKIYTYKERVFCYELYHQLRVFIENQKSNNENLAIWDHALLQGELQKNQLSKTINEKFKVRRLNGIYVPDFILHQPHTANHQKFVMEVKTKPSLIFNDFKKDIIKLIEFVEKYNFENAFFLVINNNPEDIFEKIKNNKKILLKSLPNETVVLKKILIIIKENFTTEPEIISLYNLICSKPFKGFPNLIV